MNILHNVFLVETNILIYFFVFINFITFSFKLVLKNNFSHSTILNRVNCKKQILPSMTVEPTTSCIRGNRLNRSTLRASR